MKKFLLVLLAIFSVLAVGNVANAGTAHLNGWAWSSNIGWISFNSWDGGTGNGGQGTSTIEYFVNISTTTGSTVGTLSGYAWSSNVGWIDFNKTSGCSTGSCTPTVDTSTGAVTGWIQLVSDGSWIKLSDNDKFLTSNFCSWEVMKALGCNSGVSFDTVGKALFGGYAFESNEIGWIGFNVLGPDGNGNNVHICVPGVDPGCSGGGGFTVSCGGTYNSVTEKVNFNATITGDQGAYTYQWKHGNTNISGATNQTYQIAAPVPGSIVEGYSVEITDSSNVMKPATCASLTIPPSENPDPVPSDGDLDLFIGKNETNLGTLTSRLHDYTVSKGSMFRLQWKINSSVYDVSTCHGVAPSGDSSWEDDWATSDFTKDGYTDNLETSGADRRDYTFYLSCQKSGYKLGDAPDTSPSILHVRSSTEVEI